MLSLPVRHGGLGIVNPVLTADREFCVSKQVTAELTNLIISQESTLENYDQNLVKGNSKQLKEMKEGMLKQESFDISKELNDKTRKSFLLAQEKGVGSWLTVLPIESLGYKLNKEEFLDSIRLRYGWEIPNTPSYCVCGESNSLDHSLSCKSGAYVILRHNKIRDLNADFLQQACYDVKIEPDLLPIESNRIGISGNTTDKARLDIAARGLWGPFQRTMFDVRVFHPHAPSNSTKSLASLYQNNEREKMSSYSDRVTQIERSSFTPLVYSTHGGMAKQAISFHKRLSLLIARKKNERYSDVICHMRTRLRFTLLRSVLISLRGIRSKKKYQRTAPLMYLDFGLIPEVSSYEAP